MAYNQTEAELLNLQQKECGNVVGPIIKVTLQIPEE